LRSGILSAAGSSFSTKIFVDPLLFEHFTIIIYLKAPAQKTCHITDIKQNINAMKIFYYSIKSHNSSEMINTADHYQWRN